jgi:tetratricopeptide (TPR) repeat protein
MDKACDSIIEEAKKDYDNRLVPFAQHAEKIRLEWNNKISDFFSKNQNAKALLKEYLEKEEKEHPEIPQEARWAVWEEISQKIRKQMLDGTFDTSQEANQKSIQERFDLSWKFIDRVYSFAEQLMDEGKYQEAEGVFNLLIFFHPYVVEYWQRKAAALFGGKNFEEALNHYVYSLLFEPENPVTFFEMARCYFQLREVESCLASLEICLKYCDQDTRYSDLKFEATTVQQALASKQLSIEGEAK